MTAPYTGEKIRWTGDNLPEVEEFMGRKNCQIITTREFSQFNHSITINTHEDNMEVRLEQYINKHVDGTFTVSW